MNLFITPVFNAHDKVKELCQSLDYLCEQPFWHVLVDDHSSEGDLCLVVPRHNYRKILKIYREVTGEDRKNGQGQAMQLAYDWAHYKFINEKEVPKFDHIFLIESDVIPLDKGFDSKMIEISETLPKDWATLDVQSVDKDGRLTYPTSVAPRHGFVRDDLEHMHYADFQCTLFHPACFSCGVKWSDYPSHFDQFWSRAIEEKTGMKHYRTMVVKMFHYAFSSRRTLPGVNMGPSNER